MPKQIQVAIVGCGLIGKKRAAGLEPGQVKVACDLNLKKAQELARSLPSCVATDHPEVAVTSQDVDAVIVATLNSSLAPIAALAAEAGKHVLIEKPGGVSARELENLQGIAKIKNVKIRVGFNHRYHPAFQKAYEIFRKDLLGPLMFIRGRYGHGGRLGYDREWRADPKLAGGGELMDQGIHLIDLAASFLGEFPFVDGHAATYYWDMSVDDNAFIHLRNSEGKTAWLHVSCTEWKNLFSFEIYGKKGKLAIEGLGGSYGVERLHHYHMLPEMGPPETTIYEFPRGDISWKLEMLEFFKDILEDRTPLPGLRDAIAALQVVERIYQKSGL